MHFWTFLYPLAATLLLLSHPEHILGQETLAGEAPSSLKNAAHNGRPSSKVLTDPNHERHLKKTSIIPVDEFVNPIDSWLGVDSPEDIEHGSSIPTKHERLSTRPDHSQRFYIGHAEYPSVAHGLTNSNQPIVAIAWSDNRDGRHRLYVLLVDPRTGKPHCEPMSLSEWTSKPSRSSIVWNPELRIFTIIWDDFSHGSLSPELYMTHLHPSGHTLGKSIQLTKSFTASHSPSILWLKKEKSYAISWIDNRERYQGHYDSNPDRNKKTIEKIKIRLSISEDNDNNTQKDSTQKDSIKQNGSQNHIKTSELINNNRFPELSRLDFKKTGYFGDSVLVSLVSVEGEFISPIYRIGKSHWNHYQPKIATSKSGLAALYIKESDSKTTALVFTYFDPKTGIPFTVERTLYHGDVIQDLSILAINNLVPLPSAVKEDSSTFLSIKNAPSAPITNEESQTFLTAWSSTDMENPRLPQTTIHLALIDENSQIKQQRQLKTVGPAAGSPSIFNDNGNYFLTYLDSPKAFDGRARLYTRSLHPSLNSIGQRQLVTNEPGVQIGFMATHNFFVWQQANRNQWGASNVLYSLHEVN